MPTLVAGGCIEFDQGDFDLARVWERIRQGDLKTFSAVPTIFVRLLRYWVSVLSSKSDSNEYLKGLLGFLTLQARHLHFRGLSLSDGSSSPEGQYLRGKEGQKWETYILTLLVCRLFRYMNDPVAIYASFDQDGFYKTGDIAREKNGVHFIDGRASVDTECHSYQIGGHKISALDIEKELNYHPKVAEGIIVGVDDEEFGQRIEAAVVLKDPADTLTLAELRNDLRLSLSNYKLPTLLRVFPKLKKTSTMKVPKKLIKNQLFGKAH
ncbi:hypothetical protein BGW36DRAFT_425903 [Talaromyces proteolyticus]|uniref:AMP-binding enzyme C-terminal domain-containing protein n=1 Tax=Talaromyces proteolyticus TaxID=1131652 RepID=A0AAD4Q371_9EURO|nr:uncharacterized protein BGW36DRAFT_425903 [Talaromyces proteolyticus]KAH8701108.1 hypothetical protein BGW36DRAFT_425903 [Talaromyces proteolyticus]